MPNQTETNGSISSSEVASRPSLPQTETQIHAGDGGRPICRECHIRRDRCFWGLKVSFNPSRSLQLSSEDVAALVAVDRQRRETGTDAAEPASPALIIIDDTEDIVRSCRRDDAQSPENDSDCHAQDSISEHFQDTSDLIPESVQPYLGYLSSGGGEVYVHESGHDSFNDDTAARGEPVHPFNTTQPSEPPSEIFRTPFIFDIFLPDFSIAPFSLGQAFSRDAPPEPEPRFPVSQRMKADLISNYIRETATWYVWAAFILNQTTLIPTDSWVEEDSLAVVTARGNTDDYCNFAILIFARIINLLNASNGPSSTEMRQKAQASWKELQRWRRWRQQSVKPLMRVDAENKGPFPMIVFALSASICGNTFYHAGSILLLQSGLISATSSNDEERVRDPVWHARELGGISISNPSHANWVNHLQPLYIAGRVFGPGSKSPRPTQHQSGGRMHAHVQGSPSSTNESADDEDGMTELAEFPAEKMALLKHLAKIERETGWKTSDRARELRILWGLENWS
ncbi:hypothetical protein CDV31_005730 [Fusarium ambrosium]|uniref:Transcription factor domain-containing protein n=1 Tax=Fusarium ambrosium TaxID=131363 RepID=A0A428UH05_9HYPO|nr:hypothetical protein CDV31_005730 [Fusarium ambrosium]